MSTNTHIEIICAQAQRFAQAIPDTSKPLGRLYAAAAEFANKLITLPNEQPSQFFSEHYKSLKIGLELLIAQLKNSPQADPSEEFRWLQENIHLLTLSLQEVMELVKLKDLPQVRGASGTPTPRVVAIARAYFTAADFCFDEQGFAEHLDALQESIALNVAEVWALPLCLKYVLLEETIARGLQLLKHPTGTYGVVACIRSLHHVSQTSWKEVLEGRIMIDRVMCGDPARAYAQMDFESRENYWKAVSDIAAHCDLTEMDVALEALSLAQQARRFSGAEPENLRKAEQHSHVGYYLIGDGVAVLHRKVKWRPSVREKISSFIRRHPNAYYLYGVLAITLAVIAVIFLLVGNPHSLLAGALSLIALLLPASQVALELMNTPTTLLLPVRVLPKLDFSDAIPDDCVTVVAVPVLLFSEEQVRQAVEDLEIRYLGNRDRNMHFALLTDLPDSKERVPEDSPLVDLCADLMRNLNAKYAGQNGGSFFLLHRHRVYNSSEGVYMGWERKRGKLMDFARLLRGKYDSFPVKVGNLPLLPQVRFVITLDADTELPRGSAQRLVGALAHPLNQAVIDPEQNLVVSGYGILQPRIGVSVQSAAVSRLANIYSGQTGIDIYTRAVSDVYQDLYGEGIFTGKGIWEVDTVLQTLETRFPENALLSHDLIEGVYARTALASDIEVIDDYPSHYSAHSRRKHRWIRGDWQIAEWLLPRIPDASGNRVANPLSLVSRWKIFDNLRRSLVEPATFLLLLLGWMVLPGSAFRWTMAAISLMFLPTWFNTIVSLSRAAWKRNRAMVRSSLTGFVDGTIAAVLRLIFLAHQTLLSVDAIVRVLLRRWVTRRKLLEWETAAEAELGKGRVSIVDRYLNLSPLLVIALLIAMKQPSTLIVAAPVLVLWACAEPMSHWLNESPRAVEYEVSAEDKTFLRGVALRTWRFFAEYSNEEHNWLIPDNYQEEPVRVADRTSPTDLGLLLNARQAACEFGYLTVPEFVDLTFRTLTTIENLPKYRCHLFNWYSTRTLEPLPPRFVSSADSGNLAASLWSLQQGCLDRLRRPVLDRSLLEGFLDHLAVLHDEKSYPVHPPSSLDLGATPAEWLPRLQNLAEGLASQSALSGDESELVQWLAQQAIQRHDHVSQLAQQFYPWLMLEFASLLENPILHLKGREEWDLEELPAFIDVVSARVASAAETSAPHQQLRYQRLQKLLEEARQNATELIQSLRTVASRAGRLANAMDFRCLFNSQRKLLSVGFDFDKQELQPACYDLLASEARLALFVAIAKEDVPQESWFLMGRPHALDHGRPVLLSWTGTMFEYLMPSLWMKTYHNTLLERSMREAVRSQQLFVAHQHVPWGISESAYAVQDESQNYQYRAFGAAPLALHKQEVNPLVVSPYSTMLALSVDTEGALSNLRRISKNGWLGSYGFYEAVDYSSKARSFRRRAFELVRCWMAHHQGMSLLATANLLHKGAVHQWFHSNPRVQATELLLQEKPVVAKVRQPRLQRGIAAA